MGRLQKRCSLFGYIYRHFRCRNDAGSLSDVAAGLQGKEIFQHLIRYHNVFQRRSDPTYLLINNIGLLDSMWAVILPGAFSVWNMIIARTYYQDPA